MHQPWRIWIDTGGTFTDCLAVDPAGRMHRAKVLSTGALRGRVAGVAGRGDILFVEQDWGAPSRFIDSFRLRVPGVTPAGDERAVLGFDAEGGVIRLDRPLAPPPPPGAMFEVASDEEAPIVAARLVTRTLPGRPLPPIEMRLGTTRGTNALLERAGAPVAFFVTRGFADLLEIGTQQRPDLFALRIVKPPPLHRHVVEVPERLAADGTVVSPLDLAAIEGRVRSLVGGGVRCAAIALIHAWINPEHERTLETYLRVAGFEHVSASASLSPTIRLLPRAQTAVVNAYLSPVVGGYLGRVSASIGVGAGTGGEAGSSGALRVMTSAAGLVSARAFRPIDSLLSGPAGGVAGAADAAARSGFTRIITFDMGGTSTDVARVADASSGEFDYMFEHEVGSARLAAPALAVESVAAGGGSVCWFDGDELRVGPRSAGASPGPACYGSGGPLTITDVNLLLGRLDPGRFGVPIEETPARLRLDELLARLGDLGGERADADAVLPRLLDIACACMADAVRRISAGRGFDPADHALVAFGGAGPQHALRVAEALGIRVVVIPADASLLSCAGLGRAAVERFTERQVLRPLDDIEGVLDDLVAEAGAEALRALEADGVPRGDAGIRRRIVSLRYAGQESSLSVEFSPTLRADFEHAYRATYGHAAPDRVIEVEAVRVSASSRRGRPADAADAPGGRGPFPRGSRRAWFDGAWVDAPVLDRSALNAGAAVRGPALVTEPYSVAVVEAGWTLRVDEARALILERSAAPSRAAARRGRGVSRDEVATARLASIAGEMGGALLRTALSVNVKDRLDCSCAILDGEGRLAVNAPHIPVHLGALGTCVRALRGRIEMRPGDAVVTNHPSFGGSHLPDVTVVTPVFDDAGVLLAYTASRAHHAEIGGIRPGSMAFDARSLAQEGVVIPPAHLLRGGRAEWETIRRLLTSGPYPSRAPEENIADLHAQLAANQRGAEALRAFARERGSAALRETTEALRRRAARLAREAVQRRWRERGALRVLEADDALDDGTPLRVSISRPEGRGILRVDFEGSGGVHDRCLNATPAIVRAAVMYVLRLLVDDAVPLNDGLLEGVEVAIPPGLLNPPFPDDPASCPPVAAGNTETSQRVVDVLLRALGMCAESQGTMNNVAFGNRSFGFYETVCGGAGAGPGFDGADAVHTHMTNTRITDPELLERRCPVRLERFAVRRGSGGLGRWRGGDGVEREIAFLEPCQLSILSQHRGRGPRGCEGGRDGLPGRQRVVRVDGSSQELPAIGGCEVGPGDRLVLHTPGGGAFGAGQAGHAG